MIDLVDRMTQLSSAFANPCWDPHSRVLVIDKLTLRNRAASPKVKYRLPATAPGHLTVLPLKLDPNRSNKLKTLTV